MEKKTKSLQISIPADLHKKLKIECVQKEISISQYILDIVTKDMYKEENNDPIELTNKQ